MAFLRPIVFIFCLLLGGQTAFAQSKTDSLKNLYSSAYFELRDMLEGKIKPDFSRAVFLHENAYLGGTLNYEAFMQAIRFRAEIAKRIAHTQPTQGYKKADSLQVQLQASIFKLLTDTTQVEFGEGTGEQISKGAILPARYAWEDFAGQKNWEVMFVSRLMQTNEGNCHSLPYLYKLIADELQVPAWLSCAPHHLYIQSYSQETGLFNTELSSATFPKDSWLMASGYVGKDAIRNKVYMDTLTLKQSIALCMVDLAQGYQRKFKEVGFAITCLQTAQKAYPHGLSAYLAEIPLRTALYQTNKQLFHYNCLEALAKKVCALGYQEIPQAEYVRWLANPYKDQKAPNLEGEHSKAEGKFSTNPLPTFEVNTLSGGKYQETNDLTKPRRIGTLLYSAKQGKILQFVAPDTTAVPIEVSARFLSVDPLTKGYPELTPYQFASNTPIEGIDLDGLEVKHIVRDGDCLWQIGEDWKRDSGGRLTLQNILDVNGLTMNSTIHEGNEIWIPPFDNPTMTESRYNGTPNSSYIYASAQDYITSKLTRVEYREPTPVDGTSRVTKAAAEPTKSSSSAWGGGSIQPITPYHLRWMGLGASIALVPVGYACALPEAGGFIIHTTWKSFATVGLASGTADFVSQGVYNSVRLGSISEGLDQIIPASTLTNTIFPNPVAGATGASLLPYTIGDIKGGCVSMWEKFKNQTGANYGGSLVVGVGFNVTGSKTYEKIMTNQKAPTNRFQMLSTLGTYTVTNTASNFVNTWAGW